MNTEQYDSPERLTSKLDLFLSNMEKEYGREEKETTLGTRFEGIIARAFEKTGRKVVILVDEYDKPMLQAIGNTEQYIKRIRSLFADTPYEIIRNMETHYRNVIWLLFKLMGFYTQAEYRTSEGRIGINFSSATRNIDKVLVG